MALTISEDWIRERVGLKHNNLEDVRSLSLPGTYHEKISSFGDSFRQFTRLKSLDLSRNAIESLAGLENLKLLEKLNVYYNGISSLQELHRLRYNQKLQDLDLRLNPVARNEPDYRLFLIHMLPNLGRLDDRAVRDSERKAALMHFTTDQANDLTEHPRVHEIPVQEPNPRVEHIKTLSKPPNILDEDDVQVLEYMNPHRGELTGSANREANMEEYPPQTLRDINRAGIGMEFAEKQTGPLKQLGQQPYQIQPQDVSPSMAEFQAKYPNLPIITTTAPPTESLQGYDLHTPGDHLQKDDTNLKFQDEIEAYTSYKSQGHFTAKPDQEASSLRNTADLPNTVRSVELYTADDLEKDLEKLTHKVQNEPLTGHPPQPREHYEQPRGPDNDEGIPIELTGDSGEFIQKVSTIVDKYWNGSKSLLKNIRFKSQMAQMLKEYRQANNDTQSVSSMASTNASLEFEMSRIKHSLEKVKKENEDLKEKLFQAPSFENLGDVDESKLKHSFVRAQRDVKILRDRLQKSIEENKELQDQVAGQSKTRVTSTGDVNSAEIATIQRENSQLQRHIEGLNIKLKQYNQMQELATMLQESHKSLVQTNDHLLKDMDEARQRHKMEVQQLSWNYNQLKRSVGQANMPNYNGK